MLMHILAWFLNVYIFILVIWMLFTPILRIGIGKNNCFIIYENKSGVLFIFKGFSILKYESLYNGLVEIF